MPIDSLPEIPDELRRLMAEIGPRWRENVSGNVNIMLDRFSAVLERGPASVADVVSDIAYGDHERQRLDLFSPRHQSGLRPVVLFVHGGAFVSGHRNRTAQIYANVLHYLARFGIAGVNIGYRLADAVTFPGASLDIAAALDWVHAKADLYRIDRNRIFLMGHSAGAAHVGTYAYDPLFADRRAGRLAGMIVVSGRVRADALDENPNARKVQTYYGTDPSRYEACSPVAHVNSQSVPTFVAWAEFENPLVDVYCAELAYRLAVAKRRSPPVLWLRGHNHTSSIAHIGTSEEILGQAIRDFIHAPS